MCDDETREYFSDIKTAQAELAATQRFILAELRRNNESHRDMYARMADADKTLARMRGFWAGVTFAAAAVAGVLGAVVQWGFSHFRGLP